MPVRRRSLLLAFRTKKFGKRLRLLPPFGSNVFLDKGQRGFPRSPSSHCIASGVGFDCKQNARLSISSRKSAQLNEQLAAYARSLGVELLLIEVPCSPSPSPIRRALLRAMPPKVGQWAGSRSSAISNRSCACARSLSCSSSAFNRSGNTFRRAACPSFVVRQREPSRRWDCEASPCSLV